MGAKTLAYGKTGNCLVFVAGDNDYTEQEWSEYIRYVKKTLGTDMLPRALVIAGDAVPTARQRQQLNELLSPVENLKVAVLSGSVVGRGIVTALSWFNSGYRAFPPYALDEALRYLELQGAVANDVKQMVDRLRLEIRA
ncbi:MAG TPA: hypothetical protein VH877_02445 [Polyangia bacterium]|jgi:hypothetical protein|nr:hypothetical protein [Polyangia bacterium]